METQYITNLGVRTEVPQIKARYVLYARKSTEAEERQILSIDSQIKEMLQIAEKENLEIIDIRRESHSAKDSGQRPVFKEILFDISQDRYSGILTWAPDRLSRNAGDLGSLVDLMDQGKLQEIRTYGQTFKNSPNEKFLLMILCSQAKLETLAEYEDWMKLGLTPKCYMCQGEPIKKYKHWKIVENQFPYDEIAEKSHILTPIRHIQEGKLNDYEKEELKEIKKDFHTDYDIMVENANKLKSIPEHYHLHLLVLKERIMTIETEAGRKADFLKQKSVAR